MILDSEQIKTNKSVSTRTVLIEKTPEQIIFQLDDSNKKVKCTCSVRECVDLSEVAFFLHKSIKDLVTMNDIFDFFQNEKKKPGDFFLICKTNYSSTDFYEGKIILKTHFNELIE